MDTIRTMSAVGVCLVILVPQLVADDKDANAARDEEPAKPAAARKLETPPEPEATHDTSASLLTLSSSSLEIQVPDGRLPKNQAKDVFEKVQQRNPELTSDRYWAPIGYAWVAPAVGYHPLYFEDEHLERYGHHRGVLQPLVSSAHFFGRLPLVPYMIGATPCDECQYSLGHFRPGDCAPHYKTRPKRSRSGAACQAIAIIGGIFVIP